MARTYKIGMANEHELKVPHPGTNPMLLDNSRWLDYYTLYDQTMEKHSDTKRYGVAF